jgi:hypothetical protein
MPVPIPSRSPAAKESIVALLLAAAPRWPWPPRSLAGINAEVACRVAGPWSYSPAAAHSASSMSPPTRRHPVTGTRMVDLPVRKKLIRRCRQHHG